MAQDTSGKGAQHYKSMTITPNATNSLNEDDLDDDDLAYLLLEEKRATISRPIVAPSDRLGDRYVVVYDVDGCAISFTLSLLTDRARGGCIYIITYCEDAENNLIDEPYIHDDEPAQIASGVSTRVTFCLLNQMSVGLGGDTPKNRIKPVFVCDFPTTGSDSWELRNALIDGDPLSVDIIRKYLNDDATFAIHDNLNTVLAVIMRNVGKKGQNKPRSIDDYSSMCDTAKYFVRGRRGMTLLYTLHEQKVIAAYRRVYGGSSTTAFWYVSKFGPDERSLVLCTRYYLLQALASLHCKYYDLQAIKDLTLTYNIPVAKNRSGLCPQDLTSFSKLSKFCCLSGYSKGLVADWFPKYISLRITADLSEVNALKGFLERDRGGLRISDGEFIKYIYLAHFECYNRRQLKRHLIAVSVTECEEDINGRSQLGISTTEGFFTLVRAQLNIKDYIRTNVNPSITKLSPKVFSAFMNTHFYNQSAVITDPNTASLWGCSTKIIRTLETTEKILAHYGWPITIDAPQNGYDPSTPAWDLSTEHSDTKSSTSTGPMIVKRLLAISATSTPPSIPHPVSILLMHHKVVGPFPVYRSATRANGQMFGISVRENWNDYIPKITKTDTLAVYQNVISSSGYDTATKAEIDFALTFALSQLLDKTSVWKAAPQQHIFASPQVEFVNSFDFVRCAKGNDSDMRYNRNEIFNNNLAVSNIILDVDMHVRGPVKYTTLHAAMRGFRTGVIKAMELLFPHSYNHEPSTAKSETMWQSYPVYFYKTECVQSNEIKCQDFSDIADDADDFHIFSHMSYPISIDDEGWEEAYAECDIQEDEHWRIESAKTSAQEGNDSELHTTPSDSPFLSRDMTSMECTCNGKIGFRICIPVPPPYIICGATTVVGLARILQQAVLLERDFIEASKSFLVDYDIIDYGVYGHGRSLRMPFFGKCTPDKSVFGRLLPFYVVPDTMHDDPIQFLMQHFNPENFHFHSKPRLHADISELHVMRDIKGDFVSFFDKKVALNRASYSGPRTTLTVELNKRGANIQDPASIEAFVNDAVLGDIESYIETHFQDRAIEYKYVVAICRVIKSDWILLQIVPKGTNNYRTHFSCVRHKHRRATGDSVRTFCSLSTDTHGRLCASIGQQCFASKCGNNKFRTLFTVDITER